RIGEVEDQHAKDVVPLAAQRAGQQVWLVTELLRRPLDVSAGLLWNIAGERRLVEHDGYGGGREAALLGDIPQRRVPALPFARIHGWSCAIVAANPVFSNPHFLRLDNRRSLYLD